MRSPTATASPGPLLNRSGAPYTQKFRQAHQLSEELTNSHKVMWRRAEARLERLVKDETAQIAVAQVYRWFQNLATASSNSLDELHRSYRFICIVGIPRTGGSYLTGELFAALGHDVSKVPAAIAHDGFPEAHPFVLSQYQNTWITSMLSMSEYLAMLEVYLPSTSSIQRTVIPKKLTKGVYAGGFFRAVFGSDAEYIITIRHPVSCCISTYEKSGGLPEDGKFRSRSTIEKWIARDLDYIGVPFSEVQTMNYFDAYARYWEYYYINLAVSGLTANRSSSLVPFGQIAMEEVADQFHTRFGSMRARSNFVSVSGLLDRHPNWIARAEEAIRRVDTVWQSFGLIFPKNEILEGL